MAKGDKKVEAAAPTTKKQKEKKAPKLENYQQINQTVDGDRTTTTRVLHVRDYGVHIETTVSQKGQPTSVATTFVPGIKPKKKGEAWALVKEKSDEKKAEMAVKRAEKKAAAKASKETAPAEKKKK